MRNPDGTYNGIKVLAAISGLSEAEINWAWDRIRYLVRVEGKTSQEAKAIALKESETKPWENK